MIHVKQCSLRQPTPAAEVYAWHTAIIAGLRPITPVGEPQCGWYRRRLVRGGIFVPARIWLDQPIDPDTGELTGDEALRCEVGDLRRDPDTEWPWLARHPISQAEWDYLVATRRWAAWHAPDHPEANPRRPIDRLTAPIPF